MNEQEHRLQVACVNWFKLHHRKYKTKIFSIPNGGKRHKGVAIKLKKEGAMAGVGDLFVMTAKRGYHGLFIEMKFGKNAQSQSQRIFEKSATEEQYLYKVVNSLELFMELSNWYLE